MKRNVVVGRSTNQTNKPINKSTSRCKNVEILKATDSPTNSNANKQTTKHKLSDRRTGRTVPESDDSSISSADKTDSSGENTNTSVPTTRRIFIRKLPPDPSPAKQTDKSVRANKQTNKHTDKQMKKRVCKHVDNYETRTSRHKNKRVCTAYKAPTVVMTNRHTDTHTMTSRHTDTRKRIEAPENETDYLFARTQTVTFNSFTPHRNNFTPHQNHMSRRDDATQNIRDNKSHAGRLMDNKVETKKRGVKRLPSWIRKSLSFSNKLMRQVERQDYAALTRIIKENHRTLQLARESIEMRWNTQKLDRESNMFDEQIGILEDHIDMF